MVEYSLFLAASPYLGFFSTLGKIVGIFLGIFAVGIIGLIVFVDIWAKFHVRGKVYAIFVDNRSIVGALLAVEDQKVYYGRGEKKEMYLLEDGKQYLSLWPAGLPRLLQTVVRTYWYVRNQPKPIDPSGKITGLTAKMLRMISDEAMVKQTWKDVREAAGVGVAKKGSSIALYLVFGCFAMILFNLYMTMQANSAIKAMQVILQKAFGQ